MDEKILAQIAYLDDSQDKAFEEGQAPTGLEAADLAAFLQAAFVQLEMVKKGRWRRNEELSSRVALLEQRVERIARRVVGRRALPTVQYVYAERPSNFILIPKTELAEKRNLEAKVWYLESQLRGDRPYSQLYKLGAGSLFVALISLAFWGLTGIGAPFHPIFAVTLIPASLGAIVMAFLIRPGKKEGKAASADS